MLTQQHLDWKMETLSICELRVPQDVLGRLCFEVRSSAIALKCIVP